MVFLQKNVIIHSIFCVESADTIAFGKIEINEMSDFNYRCVILFWLLFGLFPVTITTACFHSQKSSFITLWLLIFILQKVRLSLFNNPFWWLVDENFWWELLMYEYGPRSETIGVPPLIMFFVHKCLVVCLRRSRRNISSFAEITQSKNKQDNFHFRFFSPSPNLRKLLGHAEYIHD